MITPADELAVAAPPSSAYLRVDEIGIALHAPRESRVWWEAFRRRMADRLTTVAVRMPGDLVDVACDDRSHAEWLRSEFRRRGVPQRSLTIHEAQS